MNKFWNSLCPFRKWQIVAIVGSLLMQPYLVYHNMQVRGYFAFGGEWLLPIFTLLFFEFVQACAYTLLSAAEYYRRDEQ